MTAAALALATVAGPTDHAHAQVPAGANLPVPDSLVVSKMIWSALSALDQANTTGNYSVLRDLGAPSFQANNSVTSLAVTFQLLRSQQVDLSNTLIVTPNFEFPPAIVQSGLLRARGRFPLRPTPIAFDLLFESVNGRWKIFGIAVVPLPAAAAPATLGR